MDAGNGSVDMWKVAADLFATKQTSQEYMETNQC